MGVLRRLFGRPNPSDVFRMSQNPDDFVAEIARRKFWRRIDTSILAGIARNASGEMELLRNFVFVSEQYRLVENNFVALANSPETIFGSPMSAFALTLYRLGSDLCKHSVSIDDPEQQEIALMTADMAFTSAVLCDQLQLEAYAGMASLYGEILFNKNVALEWCGKYKSAEQKLLHTPDERLSLVQQSAKRQIEDPDEAKRALQEVAAHAPHLLNGQPLGEERSMREMIDDLERRLLTS